MKGAFECETTPFQASDIHHFSFARGFSTSMLDGLTKLDLILGIGGLVITAYLFQTARRTTNRPGLLPPGPTPLPLIGNLLDLPKGRECEHWAKHKDIYGETRLFLFSKVFG